MLEKPELEDGSLIACLYNEYGLHITRVAFLPLGADVNTAVYQLGIDDGRSYFLKLRRGPFNEMNVAIPSFLGDEGIAQVIAPLITTTGQPWCRLEPFTVTLYPFVEGLDAYQVALSEQQWVEFGAALKRIHTAGLPEVIRRRLPHETYSPHWRERVRTLQAHLRQSTFEDPVAAELATFLRARAAAVHELVDGAQRLGQALVGRPQEWILCHADIHAGNLLISRDGSVYIVDWDTALLAPKERDLMFVGSGLGRGWNQAREAAWFYRGYGPAEIDAAVLAYYRCERVVQDIAEFCKQILSTTEEGQDRSQALRYLEGQFQPNGIVEIALHAYQAVGAVGLP